MVKKYLMIGIGAVISLALVVVLISSSTPLWAGGKAAAHALDEGDVAAPSAEQTSAAGVVQDSYQVVAEAVVLPVEYATLSMQASGVVAELAVEEGSMVDAGQLILRLQDAHQRAAVAQAEAGLASARARLAGLEAGPRNPEIAAAQASLDAAQARLARLKQGSRSEELAAARASLKAAQASLERLYEGPDEHTRIAADADLANAEAALRQAQAAYDQVSSRGDIMMLPQSLALEQATNSYEAAKARYQALFAEPDADVVANAKAQVAQAKATVELLEEPVTENELAEAEAMVRQAQAQLDLLLAGARDEEIAAAMSQVDEAEAALEQAQASLADTELRAPFTGMAASLAVKVGEQVVAGQPIVELADLREWQVETDDLTELDVVRVQEGDPVVVTFDAIEGLELAGTVTRIKAIGEETLGDITYTVVVRLEEQDPRLRWNMTAVVTVP
jgi:HlyD family secretion protein